MCFPMMLTVTRRVLVHDNCFYFKNCREFDGLTERNRRIVKYFQLNCRGGGSGGCIGVIRMCPAADDVDVAGVDPPPT